MSIECIVSQALARKGIGEEIFALASEIYPICRSITGDGVRATLRRLAAHIDLDVHEVPTGTQVFDWTVPREWNIRDAYIKDGGGNKIVDFAKSNLHVDELQHAGAGAHVARRAQEAPAFPAAAA